MSSECGALANEGRGGLLISENMHNASLYVIFRKIS